MLSAVFQLLTIGAFPGFMHKKAYACIMSGMIMLTTMSPLGTQTDDYPHKRIKHF